MWAFEGFANKDMHINFYKNRKILSFTYNIQEWSVSSHKGVLYQAIPGEQFSEQKANNNRKLINNNEKKHTGYI